MDDVSESTPRGIWYYNDSLWVVGTDTEKVWRLNWTDGTFLANHSLGTTDVKDLQYYDGEWLVLDRQTNEDVIKYYYANWTAKNKLPVLLTDWQYSPTNLIMNFYIAVNETWNDITNLLNWNKD